MPIMQDIKLTLSTALLAGLMMTTTPILAQDADAETNADNDKPVAEVVQASQQEIPPTRLKFEYAPSVIQEQAQAERFLPVRLLNRPITYEAFNELNRRAAQNNQAGVYIGVVVDSRIDNWPSEHIRNVHRRVTELMVGNKEKGIKGAAELYGARVVGIIPIEYDPTDRKALNIAPEGEEPEIVGVPVGIGDIVTAMNDAPPLTNITGVPYSEDVPAGTKIKGSHISTIEELDYLMYAFARGVHLYADDEFVKYRDQILLARQDHLRVYRETQERRASAESITGDAGAAAPNTAHNTTEKRASADKVGGKEGDTGESGESGESSTSDEAEVTSIAMTNE